MANRVHLGLDGGWAFNKAELLSPGPGLKSNYATTNHLTRTCTQTKKFEKRMLCHQSLTAFYKPSSRSQKHVIHYSPGDWIYFLCQFQVQINQTFDLIIYYFAIKEN